MRPWTGGDVGEMVRGDDSGPFEPFEEADDAGNRWLTFVSYSSGKAYRSCQLELGERDRRAASEARARQDVALDVRRKHQLISLEVRRAAAERLGFLDIEAQTRERMLVLRQGPTGSNGCGGPLTEEVAGVPAVT